MNFEDNLCEILFDFKEGRINYSEAVLEIEKSIMIRLGLQSYTISLIKNIEKEMVE